MEIKLVRKSGESYFLYHSSRQICKKRVSDITYFERTGRKIIMYSRDVEAVAIYGTLSEIYNLLYDEGFEYVNKSVVVNFYQITNIKNNCVKFADGNYIEISRSRRNIIMDKFFEAVK